MESADVRDRGPSFWEMQSWNRSSMPPWKGSAQRLGVLVAEQQRPVAYLSCCCGHEEMRGGLAGRILAKMQRRSARWPLGDAELAKAPRRVRQDEEALAKSSMLWREAVAA
jgi:hypothetical protein